MKNIAIFGSTGSIGLSTLEVVRHFPQTFRVVALSTNSNIDALSRQIKEFRPLFVAVNDESSAKEVKKISGRGVRLFFGQEGLEELARNSAIERLVLAISGSAALLPLLAAIENSKVVALANKEALVMAGPIIMEQAEKKKAKILPIDSEQSAIWQCLEGEEKGRLKNIYLTASGGPFRKTSAQSLRKVTIKQVLKHPRWKMGRKVTVDSATLMNKGLELLEAMFLFGVPCEKIKILVHPEAIIHSMVEFIDGVTMAQLSATDMRIPIQYALTYPARLSCNSLPAVDFYGLKALHFEKPDFARFPCLALAYEAAVKLGTAPCVLNAANEVSVEEFLKKNISFTAIPRIIRRVLSRHHNTSHPDLSGILEADRWAREEALRLSRTFSRQANS